MQRRSRGCFRYSALRIPHSVLRNGDHDVTAASRPVKAFVPVRIRLVTPTFQVQGAKRTMQNSAFYTLHSAFIWRAVEFGLSVSGKPRAGSTPASAAEMAGFPSHFLPVVVCRCASTFMGRPNA